MKEEKLKKLKEEIIAEYDDKVWFFPEYEGVKGFFGTQDIIFLCLNPSSGKFPSRYDKVFYEQLKNNNFENAHITDLIKTRATNKEMQELSKDKVALKQVLDQQIGFLLKEIEILNAKFIVTVGDLCRKIVEKHAPFKDLNIELMHIRHYSSIRYPKNKPLFIQDMKDIRERYNIVNQRKV